MKYSAGISRQNVRQLRARMLVAAVLCEISKLLEVHPRLADVADDFDLLRGIDNALTDLFTGEGVEVLTDYTRQEAGLPPRGPDGWTVEEILALERARLEAMTRPMAAMIMTAEGPKRA